MSAKNCRVLLIERQTIHPIHAVIAYTYNDTWIGLPVEWDGYLRGVGRYLFEYLQPRADRHAYMEKFLFRHVAGFVNIVGADLDRPAREPYSYIDRLDLMPPFLNGRGGRKEGVGCYCHTRREQRLAWQYGHERPEGGACWAYVVSDRRYTIFTARRHGDHLEWDLVTSLSFDEHEFDWTDLERKLGLLIEPLDEPHD